MATQAEIERFIRDRMAREVGNISSALTDAAHRLSAIADDLSSDEPRRSPAMNAANAVKTVSQIGGDIASNLWGMTAQLDEMTKLAEQKD